MKQTIKNYPIALPLAAIDGLRDMAKKKGSRVQWILRTYLLEGMERDYLATIDPDRAAEIRHALSAERVFSYGVPYRKKEEA